MVKNAHSILAADLNNKNLKNATAKNFEFLWVIGFLLQMLRICFVSIDQKWMPKSFWKSLKSKILEKCICLNEHFMEEDCEEKLCCIGQG